jgi:hypothetical protein
LRLQTTVMVQVPAGRSEKTDKKENQGPEKPLIRSEPESWCDRNVGDWLTLRIGFSLFKRASVF